MKIRKLLFAFLLMFVLLPLQARTCHALISSVDFPNPIDDNLSLLPNKNQNKVTNVVSTVCGTVGGLVGIAAGIPVLPLFFLIEDGVIAVPYSLGLMANSTVATACGAPFHVIEAPLRGLFDPSSGRHRIKSIFSQAV